MCPRRGNDPASGHPRAHQPPLGRGTSPPAWDGRLDAPGQRRRHLPSSAWTRRREVKQGKSGGSVGTTDRGKGKGRSVVRPMGTVAYRGKGQGKGKGRGEGRLGQGGRGRSKGGEKLMGTTAYGGKGSKGRAANGDRPVGAASCRRDHHTMASCQNPPPPKKLMGTTAYGEKGSKGRAANGDRPVGAASCRRDHHTMASCQNPPPPTHSPWTPPLSNAVPTFRITLPPSYRDALGTWWNVHIPCLCAGVGSYPGSSRVCAPAMGGVPAATHLTPHGPAAPVLPSSSVEIDALMQAALEGVRPPLPTPSPHPQAPLANVSCGALGPASPHPSDDCRCAPQLRKGLLQFLWRTIRF